MKEQKTDKGELCWSHFRCFRKTSAEVQGEQVGDQPAELEKPEPEANKKEDMEMSAIPT